MEAADDEALAAYGLDYVAGAVGVGDAGIRAGDRHVAAHDPLRARVADDRGSAAAVELGVDPGAYYCADQLATLLRIAAAPPRAGACRVGFIHIPPDRESGPLAAQAAHLGDRAATCEQAARIVALAIRGLVEGTGDASVVLTAFGPFPGVTDNPTAALVGDAAWIDRALALAIPGAARRGDEARIGAPAGPAVIRHDFARAANQPTITLFCAVLPLAASDQAALAGDTSPPAAMAERFAAALATIEAAIGGPPRAILSLGVDSSQLQAGRRPAFRIETQTDGWGRGGPRQRDLELARIFIDARRRGDPLLEWRP